jgi:hypothetical protein
VEPSPDDLQFEDEYQLWKADAHKWGEGKTHIVIGADATENARTRCGKYLHTLPGTGHYGPIGQVTCNGCRISEESRLRNELWRANWAAEQEEADRLRTEENAQWWEWYDGYLQTQEWRTRRALVLRRAQNICEGCGERQATQAHHLTYARVGHEMLFDLVAICDNCHARLHESV